MKSRNIIFATVIIVLVFAQGVQARTSSPVIEQFTPNYLHIEDSELFGSPEGFDIQSFLDSQPGRLKDYSEQSDGNEVSASTIVDFLSTYHAIDPRIILTLVEIKSGAVTDPSVTQARIKTCLGFQDNSGIGFSKQLSWGAQMIIDFYDQSLLPGFIAKLNFIDGNELLIESTNSASYALNKFLSLDQSYDNFLSLVGRGSVGFVDTYQSLFGPLENTDLDLNNQITVATGLRLPFGNGEKWYYTSGPHSNNAAVDFAPGGGSGCFSSALWVRAAKKGVVTKAQCGIIQISHGDGWTTSYLHIDDIQVHVNQEVEVGTELGHPSCNVGLGCGDPWNLKDKDYWGSATGSHVHFDTRYRGTKQPIAGTSFDGWVVGAGAAERLGTLTLGNVVKTASTAKTDNNEIIASAMDVDTDDARSLTSGQTLIGRRDPSEDEDLYYINLEAGQTVTINMTKATDTFDPYLTLKDPSGQVIAVNDDGGGNRNAQIIKTVTSTGRYELLAKGWRTTTGDYSIKADIAVVSDVEDNNWLGYDQTSNGRIDTNADKDTYYFNGVAGRIVTISMWKYNSNLDSYLELYNPVGTKIGYNDDGGGNRNAMISMSLSNTGVYRVVARSYGLKSSGDYQIRLTSIDPINYALNKAVHVSSTETGSLPGRNAVDGNNNSRWSSKFRDKEWIYVDLGSSVIINSVVLRWETAYASRYGIYVWSNGDWERVFYTSQGNGGTDVLTFPAKTTRYVMVYGFGRGTPWGISLWEFGVYNGSLAVMPIVSPEDPYKDPDAVEEVVPLPATSLDKDDGVLALTMGFDGEQEFVPLLTAFEGENPVVDETQAGMPVANIEAIDFDDELPANALQIYSFYGLASDNDFEGEGEQIVTYEWTSNLDGILSTTAEFTKLSIDLSVGTHTISFRAQDNEENWSECATMELIIEHPENVSRIYLPILAR